MTHDDDVAAALVRVALQNKVTQIVVGKSRNPHWLDALRGGACWTGCCGSGEPIDVYVVPAERMEKAGVWIDWTPAGGRRPREYLEVGAAIAAVTLLGLVRGRAHRLLGGRHDVPAGA